MADCFRYDKDIELANLINVKCRDLNRTFLFSMKGHTVDNIRVVNCKHKVIKKDRERVNMNNSKLVYTIIDGIVIIKPR